jgi:UDP-N-acetyl-D-mannosaminuronate dehydrogenase
MFLSDLIVGVGEIGGGLRELLTECGRDVCGFDIDPERRFGNPDKIELMHICIPFTSNFVNDVRGYVQKWRPRGVVIHSTVQPGTTKMLHNDLLKENVVYSPIRGVHARMVFDLKRYVKFYSSYPTTDESLFRECFTNDCGLMIERFSTPYALETAKIIIDSSYYGWIIVYGQLVDKLCMEHGLAYDELWRFSDQIHEFLGNRPKIYVDPEGIGGHCVLQNLDLIEGILPELKDIITKINEETKKRHDK